MRIFHTDLSTAEVAELCGSSVNANKVQRVLLADDSESFAQRKPSKTKGRRRDDRRKKFSK